MKDEESSQTSRTGWCCRRRVAGEDGCRCAGASSCCRTLRRLSARSYERCLSGQGVANVGAGGGNRSFNYGSCWQALDQFRARPRLCALVAGRILGSWARRDGYGAVGRAFVWFSSSRTTTNSSNAGRPVDAQTSRLVRSKQAAGRRTNETGGRAASRTLRSTTAG